MQLLPRKWNPLAPLGIAALIGLPVGLYSYFIHHRLYVLGIAVLGFKVLFIVLYFRRSLAAWHLVFVLTILYTPLYLLRLYFGEAADRARYLRTQSILIEVCVCLILLAYLWNIRTAYFRYVAASRGLAANL